MRPGEFFGGIGVKIPGVHCHGPSSTPGQGTEILQAVRYNQVKSLSRVQLIVTPWTAARQAPLSMGFSRQEYWSGLPFPSQKT